MKVPKFLVRQDCGDPDCDGCQSAEFLAPNENGAIAAFLFEVTLQCQNLIPIQSMFAIKGEDGAIGFQLKMAPVRVEPAGEYEVNDSLGATILDGFACLVQRYEDRKGDGTVLGTTNLIMLEQAAHRDYHAAQQSEPN